MANLAKPTDEDADIYRRLYNRMQAIWKTHIACHLIGLLKPSILLDGMRFAWEGSLGTTMADYLFKMFVDNIPGEVRFNSPYFLLFHTLWQTQNRDGSKRVFQHLIHHDKSTNILEQCRLQLAAIVGDAYSAQENNIGIKAVPVHLYDSGQSGHAVCAVFWGEYVILGDRSLASYTGAQLYRIQQTDEIDKVKAILINSSEAPLKSEAYKHLLAGLNLQKISQISMPY
jgi:hypothetical protein